MKEIFAVIRMAKVNQTKQALEKAGFPAFTCRKVLGRGNGISTEVVEKGNSIAELPKSPLGEHITENFRLIPKRYFTLVVKDDDVDTIVKTIMEVNCTSNHGDGKIFIMPILEAYRVRDGKQQNDSESF